MPPPATRQLSIEELWDAGESAFEAGDLTAAARAFQEALERDRSRARSWNYAGGVLFARGDLPGALAHFTSAAGLDPGDPRVRNNLAATYERLGELAKAEESYLESARIDAGYPLTWLNLGLLYARRLGRPDDARRAWQRLLELVPDGEIADEVRREIERLPPAR